MRPSLALLVVALVAMPAAAQEKPVFDPAASDWAVWTFGEVGRIEPERTHKGLPVACGVDGKTAVTGNRVGNLTAWDVVKRKPVWQADGWGPSDQAWFLAFGSGLADPRAVRGFTHGGAVTAVAALPDGRFATAGIDGVVRVWKGAAQTAGPFRVEPAPDRRQSVWLLAASADGSKLAATTSGRRVVVWDLTNGTVVANHGLETPGDVVYLAFAPDGKLLAGTRQRAQVFALADSQLKARPVSLVPPKGNSGRPVSAFASDSRSLLVGNGNGLLRWDAETGQRDEFTDDVAGSPVVGLAAVGKKRFVSAHQDGVVRVWDFADEARPLRRRVRPAEPVTIDRAAFSADGRVGLLVDRKGTVRVYDLPGW